ncbi:hypothetical protein TRFO_12529 [Tritrichomonas foetus]|uniref:Uncharacterized protein n=1 Tax=Tritrichomonas foetus TaxID=1144522 RepID=A0A1J4L5E9_9EUKA|nr:hypothetical protein TRFO_12529 [Tritrichomonas foetus]|eukprot:OHT17212.1 hypothetical protein TRFO_12529 [Tritrichomonas foetus]
MNESISSMKMEIEELLKELEETPLESIDGYDSQIIQTPLTSTFGYHSFNHSIFGVAAEKVFDVLEQLTPFREKIKIYRRFFYSNFFHKVKTSSNEKKYSMTLEFYNLVSNWIPTLDYLCYIILQDKNIFYQRVLGLLKVLMLPTIDDLFQTLYIMREAHLTFDKRQINTNSSEFEELVRFVKGKPGENTTILKLAKFTRLIISAFQEIDNFDTCQEFFRLERISKILYLFEKKTSSNSHHSNIGLPIYHDISIQHQCSIDYEDFPKFVKTIYKTLPSFSQIFSHLMAQIPLLSYQNYTHIKKAIQNNLNNLFYDFLSAIMLLKTNRSILHFAEALYEQDMLLTDSNKDDVLQTIANIYYQHCKLIKFILKYENNFQILVNLNLFFFAKRFLANTKSNINEKDRKDKKSEVKEPNKSHKGQKNPQNKSPHPKKSDKNRKNKEKLSINNIMNDQNNKDKFDYKNILSIIQGLIPSISMVPNHSSMFVALLIGSFHDTSNCDDEFQNDRFYYEWPSLIDFRNTIEELADVSFLFSPMKEDDDTYSYLVSEVITNSFNNLNLPENINFLSLFSIYDSSLRNLTSKYPSKNDDDNIEPEQILLNESEKILKNALCHVASTLIKKNPITDRFAEFFKLNNFPMLGRIYNVGHFLSENLNILLLKKLDEITFEALHNIDNSIKNLHKHREKYVRFHFRYEFLVSCGAVLDPYEKIYNEIMMIKSPIQTINRFTYRWADFLCESVSNLKYIFNIFECKFSLFPPDQESNFLDIDKLFYLLKITPMGGIEYYITRIIESMIRENEIPDLFESIKEVQDLKEVKQITSYPLYSQEINLDVQYEYYKNIVVQMKTSGNSYIFEKTFQRMEKFGNHLCMLLIIDLAYSLDQSHHTSFGNYIPHICEAFKLKQQCASVLDEQWLEFANDHLSSTKKKFLSLYNVNNINQNSDPKNSSTKGIDGDDSNERYSKLNDHSCVDLQSSLVKGLSVFAEKVKYLNYPSNHELVQNIHNTMNVIQFLIEISDDFKRYQRSGGFFMCLVAILKSVEKWHSFEIESITHRLCYFVENSPIRNDLKSKRKKKKKISVQLVGAGKLDQTNSQNSNEKKASQMPWRNTLYYQFYQIQPCGYYINI